LLVVPVKQGDGISTLELIDGAGLTLLIGEGVATVLSAKEATGHPAIAALSSGNLPAVANAMRERYPGCLIR